MNTQIYDGSFANFNDFVFNVFASFGYNFFDSGWVNTAILHETM